MELNKVYNEDCITYMKTLPDKCVDLIIVDPPYYGILKESWDNQWKTEEDYLRWCEEWTKECKRILKEDGSFYVWGCFGENNLVFAKYATIAEKYFNFKNWINWRKEYGFRGKTNFSYKKEELLYFVNNKDNYKFNYLDIKEPATRSGAKEGDTRVPSNIWEFRYNNMSKERIKGFPCQKPLASSERIIKASSNEGDLVYIPFAGSGNEIISCIKNNRNWIATETNEEYINEVIYPRIREVWQ